ncbi:hypothetical protein [Pseudoduganella sp. R-34]|uniref:hypothetical protein n=1 Tax=Pseudoduganella sp. R-34 TaxID=3404062 RepID=UPI003CE97ABC
MKSNIQILYVAVNSGRSKKTGNDYDMRMAQCIVHKVNRETGVVEPLIGELLLPERYKDLKPGNYEVEFEVAISRDKRVESAVYTITPVGEGAKAPAGKAPAPAA